MRGNRSIIWIALILIGLIFGPYLLLERGPDRTLKPLRSSVDQDTLRDAVVSTAAARRFHPLDNR